METIIVLAVRVHFGCIAELIWSAGAVKAVPNIYAKKYMVSEKIVKVTIGTALMNLMLIVYQAVAVVEAVSVRDLSAVVIPAAATPASGN